MARKKKKKVVDINKGWESDGTPSEQYLDEMDLLKYNYAQERLESLGQKIRLKMYEAVELKRNADIRAGQLQSELDALRAAREEVAPEVIALQDYLKEKYDVDFEVDTYDDITGRITKGERPEPPQEE